MYDTGKIILGLVIFIVLVTFPIWFTHALGEPEKKPVLEKATGKCVESKEYMNAWHMDLLNQWRDSVCRDGKRIYTSREYKTKHEMSLTRTCMKCHSKKEKFCDECHNYVSVVPYCWDCHVEPRGE
jgi:hypothetical protein